MWFRRSEEKAKAAPFPGQPRVLDGWSALREIERIACDVLIVSPGCAEAGFPVSTAAPTFVDESTGASTEAEAREDVVVTRAADTAEIPAALAGLAMRGVRADALTTDSQGLAAALTAAAGRRLPFVVHLAGHAPTRQASSTRGSHEGYHALAGTGAVLMFARNAQEVADYALIARRIAERALIPAVCAHDLHTTSHAVGALDLAGADLVRDYLGLASDLIAGPTNAQRILHGEKRRRIPILLDTDHPAGIGGTQGAESYFRALAAGDAFFSAHVAGIVDDAMREFATLTGRVCERAAGYRTEDAEFVVVAQGAVIDELVPVIDYLRSEKKIKAGLVNLAVLRPFPGETISHLLAGRRAVTVLECAASPLAGDPPLLREIRGSIERAAENGAARGGQPVHPGYAAYRNHGDRPRLLSGVYGVGSSLPSFAQLVRVFENMTGDNPRNDFYLGAGFEVETRRFPHLQTLRQRLDREYPQAAAMSLDAELDVKHPRHNDGSVIIASLSAQGALFAGNIFAQALSAATGWNVCTYPDGGLERTLQPAYLGVAFQRKRETACTRPVMTDAVLVSGEQMIETVAATGMLRRDGTLVAGSVLGADALWKRLSRRAADWVQTQSVGFRVLDARRIAAETARHAAFIDQLSIWALLGAYTRIHLSLSAEQNSRLDQTLRACLHAADGLSDSSVDEIVQTFRRGAEEYASVPWSEWSDIPHPVGEPETPWTVRAAGSHDGNVLDPTRFWQSVGYLYDRGFAASTLADPYLATAVIPARSSAFRDMTPYRLRIPSWLPSNCTACGSCWTQCPESALPSTVRTPGELIEVAMRRAEAQGEPFVQLKRLADNLAKFAARAAVQGGPNPYESLSALLSDSFARLVDKAGLDGDKLETARAEFERLCAAIDGFPVAVTDTLFKKPEKAQAGSGHLLSITLNPMACNACGICVTECADGALEWIEQTAERVATARNSWEFLMGLPPISAQTIESLVSADDPETNVNRLLDGAVYHSLIGGDGSMPGNGAKTAVHLVAAAIESGMQPRIAEYTGRLSSLITRIKERIQGKIQSGLRINDFEEFSLRLQRLSRAEVTPAALMGVVGDDAGTIDTGTLARLARLMQDLKDLRSRYDAGRASFVMTIDPDANAFWNGTYPYNPHPQPWAVQHAGDALAMAIAVSETLAQQTATEMALSRRAEAELNDTPAPDVPRGWSDLSAEERALVPRVLVLARPETVRTGRIWDVLSRGLPMSVVILDGEGIPSEEAGDASAAARLDALLPALARDGWPVIQSSIGAPGHLMQAIMDSLGMSGPSLARVYAPEPSTSGVAPEFIARLARMAVETRAVPLYHGSGPDVGANPSPDRVWVRGKQEVTEASGSKTLLDVTYTVADWAVMQARFRSHFRVVSRGHRSDRTRNLAAYLTLDAKAREGIQPYIDVRDAQGRQAIALVSREMTRLAQRVAARWNDLRGTEPAAKSSQAPVSPPAPAAPAPAAASTAVEDAYRTLTENLLRMSGYGSDDSFFKRTLREFVSHGRGNGDSE